MSTLCGVALAEQSPAGFQEDERIKRYVYDENNVYELSLHMKSVTTVHFEENEIVKTILVGDSASWEIVKLGIGNVISVKPIIDAGHTNMTVMTNKRLYTFEMQTLGEIEKETTSAQTFRTMFTYPSEEVEPVSKEKAAEMDPRRAVGGPISSDYLVAGEGSFKPISVSDNRLQTTFKLPQGAERPAIFKVGNDRQEKLVNSRNDGDTIVVDGTSDYWVLRIGDEFICVGRSSAIQLYH